MRFKLGTRTFPTKAAAKEAVRSLLYSTPKGTLLNKEDEALVYAAAQMHYHFAEKFATPHIGITIGTNNYKNNAFHIVRDDGTDPVVISIDKMWKSAEQSEQSNFTSAARTAIRPSILQYKKERFGNKDTVTSDLDSTLLDKRYTWDEVDVDHGFPKFSQILNAYVKLYGMPPTNENHEFTQEDAAHFRKFHDAHARLRIATIEQNRSYRETWHAHGDAW